MFYELLVSLSVEREGLAAAIPGGGLMRESKLLGGALIRPIPLKKDFIRFRIDVTNSTTKKEGMTH